MPITGKQKEERRKHLGSSDMAAVLGVSPYASAYDVWLEKTGRCDGPDENEAMAIGSASEAAVIDLAERELGKIKRNQRRVLSGTPLASNIDGILVNEQLPVEAKTAGLRGPLVGAWGEFGTDDVPEQYIIQCHVHMLCMKNDPDLCYMPSLLGGRGVGIYQINRDKYVCDAIVDRAVFFWEHCIVRDTPPQGSVPSLKVVRKARRVPDRVGMVPYDLYSKWQNMKELATRAKLKADELQAAVLSSDPDAEAFEIGEPDHILTYYETERKGYTVAPTKVRTLRRVKRPIGLLENKEGNDNGE